MAEEKNKDLVDIRLPIRSVPKGRPRFSNGHVYTPEKTVKAERDIGLMVKSDMNKRGINMTEGPVSMELTFCFKQKGNKPIHCKPVDTDNLAKLVLDACQGVIYKNDNQVIRLQSSKVYGDMDYIHIIAKEINHGM